MRKCRSCVRNRLLSLGGSLALLTVLALPASSVASPLMSTRAHVDAPPVLAEMVRMRGGGHVRGRAVVHGTRGGVAVRGRYGAAVRGPRGNVAAGRRGVRRPVVVAPGWRRPAAYWWRPGAAVAAGAALGVVTAAAAASYVGQPPAPGYCRYYTNPQRTQGFWDVCP